MTKEEFQKIKSWIADYLKPGAALIQNVEKHFLANNNIVSAGYASSNFRECVLSLVAEGKLNSPLNDGTLSLSVSQKCKIEYPNNRLNALKKEKQNLYSRILEIEFEIKEVEDKQYE